MAKKVTLPLEMANGAAIRTTEESKENGDLETVVFHYHNRRLLLRLSDPVMRRMLYIGGSRANSYLKAAFLDDVEQKGYREIVNTLAAEQCGRQNDLSTGDDIKGPVSCTPLCPQEKVSLSGTRKSIVKLLGMESE